MKSRSFIILLTAFATVLTISQNQAQAQSKAFKVTGEGTVDAFPAGVSEAFSATGNATHFGNYEALGNVIGNPNTGAFSGSVNFIAANGDELTFDFVGTLTLGGTFPFFTSSTWDATFTPDISSGTGRFTRVTGGSFRMIAKTGAFFAGDTDIPFSWSGDGRLEFAKGKGK